MFQCLDVRRRGTIDKRSLQRGLQHFNLGDGAIELDEMMAFLTELGVDEYDAEFDYEFFLHERTLQLKEYYPEYTDDWGWKTSADGYRSTKPNSTPAAGQTE